MRGDHSRVSSSSLSKARRGDDNAVDLVDCFTGCARSRCCRRSCSLVAAVLLLQSVAPVLFARCAWAVLPDFRWAPLKGLVYLATRDTGAAQEIDVGSDWAFVCAKAHCPAESWACLLDSGCRKLVGQLTVTSSCSRELTRERVCGDRCSRAATELLRCLDGPGAPCVYARHGQPVVVRRRAVEERTLQKLAALAAAQDAAYGHMHRTFGAVDGTKGHDVTWLTPGIYMHTRLLAGLKALAIGAAAEGGWGVRRPHALRLRCAERLQYSGGNSSGLGWHWDVGSTLTMVLMMHTANASDGQLQVAGNECAGGGRCCEHSVRLERGDVAIYSSRHRHRVSTVHEPRTTVVLEWWRGEPTEAPTRPLGLSHLLQEPQTDALLLGHGLRWPWSAPALNAGPDGDGGGAQREAPLHAEIVDDDVDEVEEERVEL